jgi:Domain of unknown function (DUF4258)
MPSILQRLRERIRSGNYFLSWHMEFETMVEHNLIREDVESAILAGRLVGRSVDTLGTQYLVEGPTTDDRMVVVVARLTGGTVFIVTAYE